MLHAEIRTAWQRQNLTSSIAEAEIQAGLRQLDDVLADPRVASLAEAHAVKCEYVEDYETGRAVLAAVARDGGVNWQGFRPHP